MHPPIGGGVSTDFKSANRIKISQLVQILFYFYWFGAPHPGVGGGWSGCLGGWGWCGDLLDDVGMMGTMRGRHGRRGDHGDNMWRPRGKHVETMETTDHGDHMGTFWRLWGWCGDDVGMTGMTWGWCGDDGDNEITKNAITFEWIEIIEFRLKIWDP